VSQQRAHGGRRPMRRPGPNRRPTVAEFRHRLNALESLCRLRRLGECAASVREIEEQVACLERALSALNPKQVVRVFDDFEEYWDGWQRGRAFDERCETCAYWRGGPSVRREELGLEPGLTNPYCDQHTFETIQRPCDCEDYREWKPN
jgi:hypothetical protein